MRMPKLLAPHGKGDARMSRPMMDRLSWNMGDDGVVTIYARATEGGPAWDVADIFRRPLKLRHGMTEEQARAAQISIAERMCDLWNNQEPTDWECPLGLPGCRANCGSYGCGN